MKLKDYKLENWDGKSISTKVVCNSLEILLLKIDTTEMPNRIGAKNLIAVDDNGNIVWIASLPSQSLYSSYDTITLTNDKLQALSGSDMCEMDPMTGRILTQAFIK